VIDCLIEYFDCTSLSWIFSFSSEISVLPSLDDYLIEEIKMTHESSDSEGESDVREKRKRDVLESEDEVCSLYVLIS
jgi:hypothetical protein